MARMAHVKDLHTTVGGPIDDDVTGSGHDEAAMSGTKLRTSDTAMWNVRKPSAMRLDSIDEPEGGRRVVFSDIVVNLLKSARAAGVKLQRLTDLA